MMAQPKRGENRSCYLLDIWGSQQLIPALYPEDEGWLEWAQACVGGYVRLAPRPYLKRDVVAIYCNEDGLPLGLEKNMMAGEYLMGEYVGRLLVYVRD